MRSEVYIGLVGVGPKQGCTLLGDAKGAYVNALALASSSQEYETEVSRALAHSELYAFEFEEVEPFEQRASHRVLDKELHDLAFEVVTSKRPRFATFHTFAEVDA